jgi:hypothetical protein
MSNRREFLKALAVTPLAGLSLPSIDLYTPKSVRSKRELAELLFGKTDPCCDENGKEYVPAIVLSGLGNIEHGCILPFRDMHTGHVGAIYHENATQKSQEIDIRLFPKPAEIRCTAEQFLAAYEAAKGNNYFITRAHEPRKLRAGFVVLAGSGVTWFNCRLAELRAHLFFKGAKFA